MKPLLFLCLLITTPAWADCGSYERCMDTSYSCSEGRGFFQKNCEETVRECKAQDVQKAIAYKLDEISKNLDRQK